MSDQRPNDPNEPPQPQEPAGGPGPGQFGAPYGQYGDQGQPRPWEQGGEWESQPGGQPYPRQHLLPQEIKPGRNRKPMFITIGVVLALVIAGGIAYLALRDNGESNREAYCAALRDLTHNGDLTSAIDSADQSTVDKIQTVMDLAPDSVADSWRTLDRGIKNAQSGSPDMEQALSLFSALKTIAGDAQDNCNLDLNIPFS